MMRAKLVAIDRNCFRRKMFADLTKHRIIKKHPILLKTIFDSLYAQKQRKNELRLKKREKAAGHPLPNETE